MPDIQSRKRVQRMREARKASGECETNVWVPERVNEAITKAVQAGRFPNKRQAIIHALEQTFMESQSA